MPKGAPPLIEMMSRLIAAQSVSCVNPAYDHSNQEVVALLEDWLNSAGFTVEIQNVSPGKYNLIAHLGAGEQGLALCGHTDTVPFDEGLWRSDPLRMTERDSCYFGLGTADMKSFLALAIEAARGLSPEALLRPLYIIATADEESSMSGVKALSGHRFPVTAAVIGEPTCLRPVTQHKGVFMEAIRFIGRSGHASNPRYGNSALEGMTALVAELQHYRDHTLLAHRNPAFEVDSPTLNFGRISGGDNPNRICGDCELQLDVRLLPGMDLDETRNQIRDAAEKVARRRGLKVECAALFDGVPAFHTPENAAIVQCVQKLCGCHAGAVAFATEGPYLARMGIDTIIMGPGDIAVAHQPDEHLALAAIPRTLEILKGLIQQYCR